MVYDRARMEYHFGHLEGGETPTLLRLCKNSANVGRVAKYKLPGSELAGVWFRGAVHRT